ncbi:MAG: 6-bladed beta-propeller [Candidatus Saganbacteria bacterium]|nr:6-bladed beta-propeller [Candidatus Saganbacteria bacterium]
MKITICVLCSVLCALLSLPVYAMGEAPPTTEVIVPILEYVRQFGHSGSGDGQFFYPNDLDVAMNSFYVADTGNNRVQKLDDDGTFAYQFGGFGTEVGKFNSPVGIAVDFNFRIYVSEKDNDRVQIFDNQGNFLSRIATGEIELKTIHDPAGIDVDLMGNVYIADSGNDRILKFDDGANFQEEIGAFGYGDGFFDTPLDVALDRNQDIYVADTGNNRIQKLDMDGYPVFAIGEPENPDIFYRPSGIAVDDRFIYVCDSGNNRVKIFLKQTGQFVLSFGKKGTGPEQFDGPIGISIANPGRIFVADTGNNRIQEFKLSY